MSREAESQHSSVLFPAKLLHVDFLLVARSLVNISPPTTFFKLHTIYQTSDQLLDDSLDGEISSFEIPPGSPPTSLAHSSSRTIQRGLTYRIKLSPAPLLLLECDRSS